MDIFGCAMVGFPVAYLIHGAMTGQEEFPPLNLVTFISCTAAYYGYYKALEVD